EDIAPEMEKLLVKNADRLFFTQVDPYTPFMVGEHRVTALKARHGSGNPYNYVIERDGKALLYAHDTAYFRPETWDYLARSGVRFSLCSLDCTNARAGFGMSERAVHMGLPDNVKVREKLFELGLADEKTRFVVNHFSHNGADADYDTFLPIAEGLGFEVSFDGMEVVF
ncbi:MAG: hypothetical protein II776_00295, partial [Clostridia bacterium]|nr:hypothetical protein [Clostridia bacterium]